ncbi:MAG TPA: hypothetical protein VFB41_10905 [Solirubrobacteraceae bacterium]|nr:hypothetical protein [Solirubrobacteraceae bacterium]
MLLVIAAVEAAAWATALPPLQGPDEIAHLQYTQEIVETPGIPWRSRSGGEPVRYSTEIATAVRWGQLSTLAANPPAHPAWTAVDEDLWRRHDQGLGHRDRADGGWVSALRNPPLYYVYEAVPYLVTYPASIFTREYVMRLANIPLLLVVVASTWLLLGHLFRRSRWLQTVGTAVVTLNPQLTHLAAIVNPDIALAAIWSLALLICVRTAEGGITRGRVAGLAALSAASALTQPRGVPLFLAALLAIGLAWLRARRSAGAPPVLGPVAAWSAAAASVAAAGVIYVWYATRGELSAGPVRQFASYLWQFYLPKLGFLAPNPQSGWTVRDVYIDRFYGTFAQLEVTFPAWLDHLLALGSAAGVVAVVVALVVHRGAVARRRAALAVMAAAALIYILALHAAAWRNILIAPGDPILTGRYLVPLIALFGVCVAMVVSALPRRVAGFAGAAIVSIALVVQFAAIGAVLERFYA